MGTALVTIAGATCGGAVDNARLLAQANYGHCAVLQSKLLMYFIILDCTVQVMIQVQENINLKCLAVEDCLTGHYRAWADYVCGHDSLQWSG